MPAGTFLANLVPWWRAPYPPFAAWAATLVAAGLIAGVALATAALGGRPAPEAGVGPWRGRSGRPALVVAAVTAGVLVWDAVTGATLQINSMLGYNPLVAGRSRSASATSAFAVSRDDGSATATVLRKLDANLDLLFSGPHTIAALVVTGAVSVWLLRAPAPLAALYAREPWLRPALVSAVAMAWIAFATNDSGVAIPLVVMLVAGPTVMAVHTLNQPGRA